ncbi:MAG: GGDEF domain-containing protein, partial [Lachnospiraceae bacterium]|nr:GGDEF domain-containing protein [Lachnospiraceae bacterium]
IDGFKGINDCKGHAYGDQVLQEVADALKDAASGKGFCYRYGGDEFVLILSVDDPEEAEEVKKKLSDRLRTQDIYVSIGISYPEFGKIRSDLEQNRLRDRLETYIQKADHEMYCYKRLHHTAR